MQAQFAISRRTSLGRFLFLETVIVIICLGGLLTLGVAELRYAQYLMERCQAAQLQLALATRMEGDVNMLALAEEAAHPTAGAAVSLRRTVEAYRTATDGEQRLIETSRPEAGDANDEAFIGPLAAMADRLAQRPLSTAEIVELRRIVRGIADRETHEIAHMTTMMDSRQSLGRRFARLAMAGAAIATVIASFALWRMMVRPIQALVAATARLQRGESPAKVAPAGLLELRQLAASFNAMADEIEQQVAARTTELASKNEKLAAIDRTRRLFFAKISHELRTPLTVMMGEADVALRSRSADETRLRAALAHVTAHGGLLTRRLDDLLATARSEDGMIQLSRKPFDVFEAVRSAAVTAGPYALSSGVSLRVDVPDQAAPALGDRAWLQQAMLAVLDNSVKFAGDEGVVTLSARREESQAVITVTDSGPGVAQEELEHIFDPYVQTDHGRLQGGSGLGLALARWITLEHGGSVVAHNDETHGFVVEFKLALIC